MLIAVYFYSDIVSAQMSTKPITFTPAQQGWIFKQDKVVRSTVLGNNILLQHINS